MIKYSFIIPCFNSENTIKICLDSILAQNKFLNQLEILIIDDGSHDSTKNIIHSYDHSDNVKIILHPKNRGLSAARNSGIKNASGEILVFIDSDMVLSKNWLEVLDNIFNDDNPMGVMGQYNIPKNLVPNTLDRYLYSSLRGAKKNYKSKEPIKFKYFLFSNTAIKKEVMKSVRGFDESFKKYGGEDTELAIRLFSKYKNQFLYSNNLITYHHGQKSLKEFCTNMKDYGKNNLPRLIKKYPQHKKSLGGYWLDSFLGYLLFNRIFMFLNKIIIIIFPFKICIRYIVAYNTIIGYRERKK